MYNNKKEKKNGKNQEYVVITSLPVPRINKIRGILSDNTSR